MRDLLQQAADALRRARAAGDADAIATQGDPAIVSGYRPAARQFQNWDRNFARYYEETRAARTRQPGGPLGEQAARVLEEYIRVRLAAPGFSLHQSGVAADLGTTFRGERLGPNTGQIAQWRRSWLFRWLQQNAARFGFQQNPNINEPWHWEYHAPQQPPGQ
jgi:LAS superfamily LD-carboxypeptidase LdcB